MKTITRSRLPLRTAPREAAPSVAGDSIEEVIGRASNSGEHVIEFAEALCQTSGEEFLPAAVAVTDSRVLVVGATSDGFEVKFAEDRAECWVASSKSMSDGSTLLVLGSDAGFQCLYFKAAWKPEADTIITRLAEGVEDPDDDLPEPKAAGNDIDRFELSLEFAGLFEAGAEDAEED